MTKAPRETRPLLEKVAQHEQALLNKLEEAKAEAQQIIEDAEAEARKILIDTDQSIKTETAEVMRTVESVGEEERQKFHSDFEMRLTEMRAETSKYKDEVIKEAISLVLPQLDKGGKS